jgi:hypothetical protein
VGLIAQVEIELRNAGLIDFFKGHKAAFKAMAVTSYEYAATYVTPTTLPVRRDDVAENLVFALQTNETFRDFLAANHLPQKFWFRRFADLIVDYLWEELHTP